MNDTRFLHGGEFFLSCSQLLWVESTRFSKNRRTRVGEKMVSHLVTRFRGYKTVGGEHVRKIFKQLPETLRS